MPIATPDLETNETAQPATPAPIANAQPLGPAGTQASQNTPRDRAPPEDDSPEDDYPYPPVIVDENRDRVDYCEVGAYMNPTPGGPIRNQLVELIWRDQSARCYGWADAPRFRADIGDDWTSGLRLKVIFIGNDQLDNNERQIRSVARYIPVTNGIH